MRGHAVERFWPRDGGKRKIVMASEPGFWEKRWGRRQQADTEEVATIQDSGRVHAQATVELPITPPKRGDVTFVQ